MNRTIVGVLLPALLVACGCQHQKTQESPAARETRIFDGFGSYTRTVSTDSPEAQQWFNQGMQLLYGFNHDEAVRSFEKATEHDPDCAMAWWGISYAQGININDPMMSEQRSKRGYDAAQTALSHIDNASPPEQALVRAVVERYEWPAPEDRAFLDQAYADAMESAHEQFPDDPDIGTLYAESLMNLQPWDYWTTEGEPKGRIVEVVDVLEEVIAIDPDHPGANHFYIHAVEASDDPDRAIPSAEVLTDLVPGSGHLVHMPSHVFVRVGRYADAADSNVDAIEADRAYFAVAPQPHYYYLYYAHNLHFLAYAAMMEGRYQVAINAAKDLRRDIPDEFIEAYPGIGEALVMTDMHVYSFGKWHEILKQPIPPASRKLERAIYYYARSIAYSALGQTGHARSAKLKFEKWMARVPGEWLQFNNRIDSVLPIAESMIAGELLFREGRTEEAFSVLREGIEAEDALVYDEPPGWMLPVRHALGALLMSEGRYAEAEQVYREDLERNKDNGWALIGLEQALISQGKFDEAERVSERLDKAWTRADVDPSSSCFCEPGVAMQ